jgi:alpha-D-xyloside xylohydrolase
MMMLNAWASHTKPWSFPEVTDMVRDVIQLRTNLLPYIYTAFYNYSQKGIPPFRAMVLENGYVSEEKMTGGELDDTENPYEEQKRAEVTDQYMMGPSILVAPVFTGHKERSIVLPKGNWYDFYTGEFAGNGETISIKTKLEQIPLFVKDGAIIPMLSANSSGKKRDEESLEVRHYGTKENTFLLYNDDGESYDFENGDYSLLELKAERKNNGKMIGKSTYLNNRNFNYGEIEWRWMTDQEKNINQ